VLTIALFIKNKKENTIMKKIINTITFTFTAWIVVSTLQGMLHIGTITNANFWQLVVNLIR
jgi:hypothetical protein